MSDTLQKTIDALLQAAAKAAGDSAPAAAMQFTQAALNAAHIKHAMLDHQLMPPPEG